MYILDGKIIGDNLKNVRLNRGLSLRDMGEILNMYHTQVYQLESSPSIPTLPVLIKYCNKFDLDLNQLLKPTL